MSTAQAGAGGSNQQAGGDADDNLDSKEKDKKDTVAFETHQKLLTEKKKRDQELEETRKKLADASKREKEREESDLKAKEDWKKLVELREKELNETKKKLSKVEEDIADTRKLSAFLENLNGAVEKQYWNLIPLDKIVVDPQTGQPDPASLQAVVRDFQKTYALVIKSKASAKGLPGEAARGGGETMTRAQWEALPNAKEMKAKFSQVDWNT